MDIELSAEANKQAYYKRLPQWHVAALWEITKGLVQPELKSKSLPMQWKYADVRPLLIEAGRLVTAEEADRRVLVLENPTFPNQGRTTSTLYAGVQMILPGETAPAHRHTPSALRFILEGEGAFTAVDGEQTTMRKGDFVITPAWTFHDHGSASSGPCFWLDGLDIPITGFFEQTYLEEHGDKSQIRTRPEDHSVAKYGQGLLPMNAASPYGLTTPLLNYPYDRTRSALYGMAKGEEPHPHLAHTLRYANPIDGGWAMPTMAVWTMFVPKGFETRTMRSSEGIVMAVAEGRGRVTIDEQSFSFGPNDIHAIPAWCRRSFQGEEDMVLFLFSDRAAQEKLGLFQEFRE